MMIPSVIQAVAKPNFVVQAYFDDGRVTRFDMKPLIARGGVFEPLKNPDFFRKVTVMNQTVAWDMSGRYDPCNCIDIDPVVIHDEGEAVPGDDL